MRTTHHIADDVLMTAKESARRDKTVSFDAKVLLSAVRGAKQEHLVVT